MATHFIVELSAKYPFEHWETHKFEDYDQNKGTEIGHLATHLYVLGSPIVPGEHCNALTHNLFTLSAKSPPEQSN